MIKPSLMQHLTEVAILSPAFIRRGPRNPICRLLMSAACRGYGVRYALRCDAVEVSRDDRIIRIALSQFPHALELSRQFDLYFSQVEPEETGGLRTIDYSRPKLHRYTGSGLEFELSSFPEEQSAIDDYFRWYTPKPGDTVFDLGAYCGVSTYHFSKLVGDTGKVFAYEPDPTNYPILLRNVARHNLSNVTALNLAVAGSSGILKFNSEGTTGSGLSRALSRSSFAGVSDVEAITFEQACERFGLPQFVKMDVECAEIEILQSAKGFLASHPFQFTVDTSHRTAGVMTVGPVEQIFAECGYETLSSADCGYMTTWAKHRSQPHR